MFIVELEKGVWLAPFAGDPGRTLIEKNAKLFASQSNALTALTDARQYHPFASAKITPVQRKFNCLNTAYAHCEWTIEDPDACPFCSGAKCCKCGAGMIGTLATCEHDSFERHEIGNS